jgi:uridine kinase
LRAERVLIDGRSGSGKTELARAIVALRPEYQLVRLDDVYPGWEGLDAASAAVPGILSAGRWREWDWLASSPGRWHELDGSRPVIVEGVGAISRASRGLADAAIWVELDDASRRVRAVEREPDLAAHWDLWAAQELAFIAREGPRELADIVMAGPDAAERAASLEL